MDEGGLRLETARDPPPLLAWFCTCTTANPP
eukprot:CAMPEP_0182524212 /NCGR_PEP_ID=MMETSP1323-20130603/1625_1 /TAXON_ID=236787 /ORGANISM="Florenciella parvula, Strain RCC1693" /LENGTH=30 /DNA_ID= /DNA_START= /DNA_END= /DNA_ORIENTATION=